jgi:acetyl esterase
MLIEVHPQLRKLLEAARGKPGMADTSITDARMAMAQRTANRARGPEVYEVRNLAVSGPGGDIPLRLYRPRNAKGIAVVFHGGGWLMGGIDSFDATSRHLANDSGVAIASVDYRLAPEHPFPAPLDDAWAATQWVARNGESLEVDTSNLAVLGESAGGNLAAVVCLLARDANFPKISRQVLVYASVDARLQTSSLDEFSNGYLQTKRDVEYAFRTYGVGSTVAAEDWRVSPLLAKSLEHLPPALLISAGCDTVRDDTYAYTRRLLESGVTAVHASYPGMLHTFFGMRGTIPDAEIAQKQAAAALRDAVSGPR